MVLSISSVDPGYTLGAQCVIVDFNLLRSRLMKLKGERSLCTVNGCLVCINTQKGKNNQMGKQINPTGTW